MYFIKLTFMDGTNDYINLDLVCEFYDYEGGSIIFSPQSDGTIVRETPDQIMNWISTGKLV